MNQINQKKNRTVSGWLALLLLCPAFLFTIVGDVIHVFAIACVVLVISYIKSTPLVRNTRNLVYALVVVAVGTILGDQVAPVDLERFFVMPSNLYCPFMIYLGVAGTLFPQRRATLCAVVATSIIATLMTGNVFTVEEGNTTLAILDPLVRHYSLVYAIVVVIQVCGVVCILPYTQGRLVAAEERQRRLSFVGWRGVGLCGVVVAFFAMQELTDRYYPAFSSYCEKVLRLHWRSRTGKVVFGDEVDLWRRSDVEGNDVVMLRAVAASEPGYLRGRVYDKYQDGKWLGNNSSVRLEGEIEEGGRYVHFFRDKGNIGQLEKVMIYPSTDFYSDVLLVPPTSRQFDLVAEELVDKSGGMLEPERWKRRGAYAVYAATTGDKSAYQEPTDEMALKKYLQIPNKVAVDFRQFAAKVFTNNHSVQSDAERLTQLSHFFSDNNYTYELGVRVDRGKDPVMEFLDKRKKGHCELFAASSVLLLRTQGIPARYVTGFVCAEKGSGDYWISRADHAHAWAEAWLSDEKRWVMVENTPPDGRPNTASRLGFFAKLFDRMAFAWGKFSSALARGDVADSIVGGIALIFAVVGWFFDTPLKAVVSGLVLLIYIYRKFGTRIKHLCRCRKEKERYRDLEPGLKWLERRLKKFQIRRGKGETLRDLEVNILQSQATFDAELLRQLVTEFERLRYQPQYRSKAKSEAWTRLIKDFAKSVSKSKVKM